MSIEKIRDLLNGELNEYKPLPFWSWNGDLEPERLIEQIDWMRDNGIGGYFMHARSGLVTEYLSDKWMECIKACADYGYANEMENWLYDENGWPSGFAGGKLLEDENNRDKYLTFKFAEFDCNAAVNYRIINNKLVREFENNGGEYLNLYIETAVSTVDILNPDVTDKFINLTHERYKKEFGDDFAKKIKGFFTDEPQYQRMHTAYTPILNDYYKKIYNEDIFNKLGLLFVEADGYRQFRYRYWTIMQYLMIENFAKRVNNWCTENGVKFTGHYIEETTLFGQMMCCAGVMPFYAYMDMPGIDWLGGTAINELPPRQIASVAAQYSKKHILTETFACCGWDVSPKDVKRIADFQFCGGVNRLCHHLIPYSEHGQRKKDFPAHYSNVNPWVEYEFKDFNKYFTRLGYLIAESKETVNVAVLHPMREAYFDFRREEWQYPDDALADKLLNNCRKLSYNGISYHFLDETLLEMDGFVNKNKIGCGAKEYNFLVLPDVSVLSATTEKLIREYIKNGGKILILGEKPKYLEGAEYDFSDLETNCTLEEIALSQPFKVENKDTAIHTAYRVFGDTPFIFVMNPTEEDLSQTYDFGNEIKSFTALDLITLEEKKLPLSINLKAGESVILFPSENEILAEKQKQIIDFKIQNAEVSFDKNYLPIDFVKYSLDGINYSEKYSTAGLFAKLLEDRYVGEIYFKYSFEINEMPSVLRVAVEKSEAEEYLLNGDVVEFTEISEKEPNIQIADISKLVHKSDNEFIIKIYWYQDENVYFALFGENVTESLKNCLLYNKELEPIYLSGDFGVYAKTEYRKGLSEQFVYGEDFYIGGKPDIVTEPVFDGFPFFAGKLSLKQNITIDNTDVILRFDGTWHIAYIKVNGQYAGKMIYGNEIDIGRFVIFGNNTIEIDIIVGNRNLLGPHHNLLYENGLVEPYSFELTGEWKEGKSESFANRYNLIKITK